MWSIQKKFDAKKFARAMGKCPGMAGSPPDPMMMTPDDLKACLLPVYIEIMRSETVTIAGLDFGEIGDGDIDDLEAVLHDSPANRLFGISEVFVGFEPAASAAAGAFI